jgi:hypothetical protein
MPALIRTGAKARPRWVGTRHWRLSWAYPRAAPRHRRPSCRCDEDSLFPVAGARNVSGPAKCKQASRRTHRISPRPEKLQNRTPRNRLNPVTRPRSCNEQTGGLPSASGEDDHAATHSRTSAAPTTVTMSATFAVLATHLVLLPWSPPADVANNQRFACQLSKR